ncbi:MAG: UbiA family prenyltransferase [Bacteroidetes bacterium]|nr:UbiA family prenyltransferase [Bacteroidota bacterium]
MTNHQNEQGLRRWWIYQKERFPLAQHGPVIFAFSFSAVAFSWMLHSSNGWPSLASIVVAFVTCLLFFFQLRISDEFKDKEEDARYRPYRPVPRGLVTLRELVVLFVLCSIVQIGLALWLDPRLLILLLITWSYQALMGKEFFIGKWLRGKHLTYLITHMAIMPLVDLYATGTEWLISLGHAPDGLFWFLLASLFNGMGIDIGRKIRSPEDEEKGVPTYSVVWGRPKALMIWWIVMGLALICTCIAAHRIDFFLPILFILSVTLGGAIVVGIYFLRQQTKGAGKWIELYSGAWTLVLYMSLGLLPLIWRELI